VDRYGEKKNMVQLLPSLEMGRWTNNFIIGLERSNDRSLLRIDIRFIYWINKRSEKKKLSLTIESRGYKNIAAAAVLVYR
jgi:hypothetical protein